MKLKSIIETVRSVHTAAFLFTIILTASRFLSLVVNRFGGNGLYLLDEPEAALSPQRLLSLICVIDELVKKQSHFIIATHSPILMAYPDAQIFQFSDHGI